MKTFEYDVHTTVKVHKTCVWSFMCHFPKQQRGQLGLPSFLCWFRGNNWNAEQLPTSPKKPCHFAKADTRFTQAHWFNTCTYFHLSWLCICSHISFLSNSSSACRDEELLMVSPSLSFGHGSIGFESPSMYLTTLSGM
jgi:hypothetical protein